MKQSGIIGLLILSLSWACHQEKTAEEIVLASVQAHGGDRVYNSQVDFDFRDKHYSANYKDGHYKLGRQFEDSSGFIQDVLTNEGFLRTINDSSIVLDEEWTGRYSRSVNSVVYFFRIPFVLTDPAVKLKHLGMGRLEGQEYFKIETTFGEEGGGEDYDDRFIYWINSTSFEVDYFAYSYSTDGGGKRFRKAINPRTIDGWLFVDHINYEPKDLEVSLDNYDQYFEEGGMNELSRIENLNIGVKYL